MPHVILVLAMELGHAIAIASMATAFLNGILLFTLNRSAKRQDVREDRWEKTLEEQGRVVNKQETRITVLEQDKGSIKRLSEIVDEARYESRKASESAKRAHQRMDENNVVYKEIRDMITLQEKALMKLNIVTEALQERLRSYVNQGKD